MNVNFDLTSWRQAVLPVKFGGLGLRETSDIALPAYLASIHAAAPLVQQIIPTHLHHDVETRASRAAACWSAAYGLDLPDVYDRDTQSIWDSLTCAHLSRILIANASQVDRARLLAAAAKNSGAWLNAIPSSQFGTLLDRESLRIGVALRIGARVCEPHVCRCGHMTETDGLHPLSCRYSAGRGPRHAALNDIVKRALTGCGIPSSLEPTGINRGDGKRPDGITLFPWSQGKCLVWDVTVVDTFAESHLTASALQPGSAAKEAEERKRRKFVNIGDHHVFEPLAFETAGTYGEATTRTMKVICSRLSNETADPREAVWLRQRISIAILRGNAASIRASTPLSRPDS